MAGKIQLTPAELLAQSQEMLDLQKEYDQLFASAGTLLTQVNENWSANLANNFAGKLLSAQKGFTQISSMLGQGGKLAASSANTFESMDSLLSKVMQGDGVSGNVSATMTAAVGAVQTGAANMSAVQDVFSDMGSALWGQVKEDWKTSGDTLEEFHQWLKEKLPEEEQESLKKIAKNIFGDWLPSYEVTYDIVTGSVDRDTGYSLVKAVFGKTNGGAFMHSMEYALEISKLDEDYQKTTFEQMGKGNIITGMINMSGSCLDEIGMGLIDVGGSMAVDAITAIPGMDKVTDFLNVDLAENWNGFMDKAHGTVTESIQGFVEKAGKVEDVVQEKVAEGVDIVVDTAKKAGKAAAEVGSAIGEDIKSAGDGLKKLLNW